MCEGFVFWCMCVFVCLLLAWGLGTHGFATCAPFFFSRRALTGDNVYLRAEPKPFHPGWFALSVLPQVAMCVEKMETCES